MIGEVQNGRKMNYFEKKLKIKTEPE